MSKEKTMSNHERTQRLALLAILSAITAIVSFLPLKTLGLEITFSMVPVAMAGILAGPSGGAIVGGVFGVVSFLQCLGYSPFGAALLAINPFFTFLVCVPTRVLAGFLPGLLCKAMKKAFRSDILPLLAASLAAPVCNTAFFMSTLVLCFYQTEFIQGFVEAVGAANPLVFVLLFVGINGLVEILCGFAIAFPCSKALSVFLKRFRQ